MFHAEERKPGVHPKLAVAHARLQAAVKTGRALAHADDPMPAADRAGGVLMVHRVGDRDVERARPERDRHLGGARAVTRGVG